MKIVIECNAEQGKLIIKALDLFSRIVMGQLWMVLEIIRSYYWKRYKWTSEDWSIIEKCFSMGKAKLMPDAPHWHGSWGIGNKNVPEDAKKAYELLKWIEYHMNHKNKGIGFKGREMPLELTDQPQVKIQIIEDYVGEAEGKEPPIDVTQPDLFEEGENI